MVVENDKDKRLMDWRTSLTLGLSALLNFPRRFAITAELTGSSEPAPP